MRMRAPSPALLAFALTGLCAPALAQQAPGSGVAAADRAAVAACVRDAGEMPRACIGAIAVVCARQAGGERREAEIDCSRREAAVWRERLQAASGALARRLEAGPRNRFAAVQLSWETYAAQKCAFVADVQVALRAPAMRAACELSEVASRAIEVERLARRQAEASQPRPRLER
jgi:uncharacterized protein YecT (DUF1311 family)